MSFQSRPAPHFLALASPIRAAAMDTAASQIALVMPCYNEAKRLDASRIVNFLLANNHVHLILVNDGSQDETLGLLTAMQDMAPHQVTVLDLMQNAGKAEAVRQGLLRAVETGAALTGYWDADLATPLESLADFVLIADRYGDVDVVFGSRRRILGHRIERSLKRRVISRLCSAMARLALRLPIGDTQCGAKLLRRTDALSAAIQHPFTAGWLFDVELFARIAATMATPRRAFYELPLSEWDEVAGSKVSGSAVLRAGFRMLGLIAQNRLGLTFGKSRSRQSRSPSVQAHVLAPNIPQQIA